MDAPEPHPLVKKHLQSLEQAGCEILQQAVKLGKTFIITNAAGGWVEFSSQRYMPSVWSVIKSHVTVISARDMFESAMPGNTISIIVGKCFR